jgi:hypothetical protein
VVTHAEAGDCAAEALVHCEDCQDARSAKIRNARGHPQRQRRAEISASCRNIGTYSAVAIYDTSQLFLLKIKIRSRLQVPRPIS